MYRARPAGVEVLLVHPGGPFWQNKDVGAWSIPKGEVAEGEDLLSAARREFQEELGFAPPAVPGAEFVALQPVQQKAGKIVHAWAFEGDCDPSTARSNTMTLSLKGRDGTTTQVTFPEVDRAEWFDLPAARMKVNPAQVALLDELGAKLAAR